MSWDDLVASRWADRGGGVHLALGVAAPLAVVALAYGLWSVSDRALTIGPLDRAAFGWAVVGPIWALAPVAAGFAWQRLTARATAMAATALGLIVGAVATALVWSAVVHPNCEFGAARTPIEMVAPSIFVGLVIGAGLGGAGLLSAAHLRGGRPWWAVAVGAGSGLAVIFAAVLAAATVLLGPACQRPP